MVSARKCGQKVRSSIPPSGRAEYLLTTNCISDVDLRLTERHKTPSLVPIQFLYSRYPCLSLSLELGIQCASRDVYECECGLDPDNGQYCLCPMSGA